VRFPRSLRGIDPPVRELSVSQIDVTFSRFVGQSGPYHWRVRALDGANNWHGRLAEPDEARRTVPPRPSSSPAVGSVPSR